MHFDADNEARVAQQRVQQLSQPQLGIVIAVTFVEHHLLGVVRPAFGVAVVVKQLAGLGWGRLQPEKLGVVSGIDLVNGGAGDRAAVESLHPLLDFFRFPVRRGQGDVEHGFGGLGFVGAGRVHGSGGEGAREGRRFLHDGRDGRWNGDDFVLLDELPQAAQSVAEGLQQLVGGRMVLAQIGQHGLRTAVGINLGGDFLELLLVAPQVGIADLEQAIQGNVHHLVVQQLLAEILRSQAEIAVGCWQQIFPHEVLILAQSFDGRSRCLP